MPTLRPIGAPVRGVERTDSNPVVVSGVTAGTIWMIGTAPEPPVACAGNLPSEPTAKADPTRSAAAHWNDRLAGRRTVDRPERHATTSSTTQSVNHAQAIHARSTATCPSHAAISRASPGRRRSRTCRRCPTSRWIEGGPEVSTQPQRHANDQQQQDRRGQQSEQLALPGALLVDGPTHGAPLATPLTSTADAAADTWSSVIADDAEDVSRDLIGDPHGDDAAGDRRGARVPAEPR